MERELKRLKLETDASEVSRRSPASAIALILRSVTQLDQLLAANINPATSALQAATTDTAKAIASVEGVVGQGRANARQDDARSLEEAGQKLWNRSQNVSKLRVMNEDKESTTEAKKLVAKIQHLALRLLRIALNYGSTIEEKLLLFELTTRTALSHLETDKTSIARTLETEAASLATTFKDLSRFEPLLRSKCALATLDFLVFRIRLSVMTGATAVAQWMKQKVDDLLQEEKISPRKIIIIAESIYLLGRSTTLDVKAREEKETTIKGAIEWLEWAKILLARVPGESGEKLKIVILKSLVFSHLQVESCKTEGEASLKELISLEPSFERKRQLFAVVLARSDPDAEIVEVVKHLVSDGAASTEQGLTITGDIYRIPENRRNLRLRVIEELVAGVETAIADAEIGNAVAELGRFLEQLLSLAAIVAKFHDLQRFALIFDSVSRATPFFRLSENSAFLVATYIQNIPTSFEQAHPEETAQWLNLLLKPAFASLEQALLAQTARIVASKLITVEKYKEADEILREWSGKELDARTEMLRFQVALLRQDSRKAIEFFDLACSASNVSTEILVWCAYQAIDRHDEEVLRATIDHLVDAASSGKSLSSVDLMAAGRLIFRAVKERLEDSISSSQDEDFKPLLASLEGLLEIARSLLDERSELPEDFAKGLTWTRLSSLKLCTYFASKGSPDSIARLYATVGAIVQLEIKASDTTQELVTTVLGCRLASLAAQAAHVQELSRDEQTRSYSALIGDLRTLHVSLVEEEAVLSKSDFAKFLKSTILLQAECHSALSEWEELLNLVAILEETQPTHESSILTLRLICDRVSNSPECPYETLRSIYRKTLSILYQSRALDPSQMAIWLRLIISVLIAREPDEAFKYFENAQQLVANSPAEYPEEEISWLVSSSWDQGIELYSSLDSAASASTLASASKWCQVALAIAQSSKDEQLATQLGEWFEGLKEQYEPEEENRGGGRNAMDERYD